MRYGTLTGRLSRSVAVGVLAGAVGFPALAQQTSQPTVETTQPAEPPAEDEGDEDRVVVTGSRLSSNFSSAAPMDILVAADAAPEGISDVASLLRSTTVAAGSPQITAVTSTAFVENGGVGAETISLRGLGANRTLVLLDGRRAGPAGTRGSVGAFDFNVLPLSAVERVEILKDGASSIYGSDAVAGVINVITKKGDGLEFDAFGSTPLAGGGEEFRINGSWGETWGDNLHTRITADYFSQKELARGQRDFFSCGQPYVFNANGSRADLIDPRTGTPTCSSDLLWGHIWFYDYTQPGAVSRPWQARPQLIQYNYGNNLQNWLPTTGPRSSPWTIPAGWFPVGYGELNRPGATPDTYYQPSARNSEALLNYHHPYVDETSLSPEIERMTLMGSAEFDLSDTTQMYAEVLLNRRMTKVNGYRQFWAYHVIYDYGGGSFYGNPLAYQQGWRGPAIGLSPTAITNHADDTTTVDYVRAVAGIRGDLPILDGWDYDIALQFSRSDGEYKEDIIWDDAISDQNFADGFCAGTMTSYRNIPCVDVNWYTPEFQAGMPTAAERAFLFGVSVGNTIYEQFSAEAYVTGDLFALPAGNVGAVLGVLYQEDSIDDTPSQITQDGAAWGSSQAGRTVGEDTTTAIYGELGVPLLSGQPLFEDLSLTLSGRYTDVDSYGSESTYKAGLNWQVTPQFRVRASQGTSFRSPALFELFLAGETSFLGQRAIDPCVNWTANLANNVISQRIATNCAADGVPGNHNGSGSSALISSSGGFGALDAETSTSRNIGVIWTPDFADLQISVDYFDIEVENEVTKLGAGNIVFGCYNSLNFATEPLCNLFNRNPAGGGTQFLITTVTDNFLNISTQQNRGIDFDALYRTETPIGNLTVQLQASKQLEDEVQLLPSSAPVDSNGLAGDPEWVGNFNATLQTGPFEFFYGIRYVGDTSNVERYGNAAQTYMFQPVRYVLSTPEVLYHSVSMAVEPTEGLLVRVGVSNLFDESPPLVTALSGEFATVGNVPLYSQYDFFGRTAFINVTKKY
jgi:iron complex outermembrane receptor protein